MAQVSLTEKIAKVTLVLAVVVWVGVAVHVCAQDLASRPRTPNFTRIARIWNSLVPVTKDYNEHMNAAERLLRDRFNPKIVVVDPDEKRRETVGHLKAAREALLKEVDALNELIEEEDY
jgi:hypothetical protein